ncbi:MAG TPA: heme-binding domain-containing protein [Chitinophagaceae bacterium]|nr:heme-binding domain-containing protein [Chitinophagaceae bacterium]
MIKKILMVLLIGLIAIQFFRPLKNQSAAESANAIAKAYPVPTEVADILKVSCSDCHSNNTVYPWYNNIQPVAWWLNHHVKEGKKELNFDEFASYKPKRAHRKLKEIIEQVKEGEMPLNNYLWLHGVARLNQDQKQILLNWAQQLMDSIAQKNNLPLKEEKK